MNVELINTGSELMLGRVLNTHQQWLCRRLADHGYRVARQTAVSDTGGDIQEAVREGLSRADLVITTGGLGPTSDDLTRDRIAQMLGRGLREDAGLLAHIQAFFTRRNRLMPDRVRVQALVPDGALVLSNPNGTAPGLAIEVKPNAFRADQRESWLIMLPGPPRELQPMFTNAVLPLLHRMLPPESEYVCRTLRTAGMAESLVEERVDGPLKSLVESGLDLGYCARVGQVDVRLAARGVKAVQVVTDAESIVRQLLGNRIYGGDEDELETVVVRLLTKRRKTLAVAESCTGGHLANRVTNISGASVVFLCGLVTYSNEAKQKLLGVRADTLAQHGAVSEPVAREMAEGVRRQSGADFALSTTGIAGPGGGTVEKPVGTVFIGFAGPNGTVVEKQLNAFERLTFKQLTADQALNKLRLALLQTT